MIPTVIIVNDKNKELHDLGMLLKNIIRTFHRTSIEGEQLYGIFEGILYVDEFGKQQAKRQDNYSDVLSLVLTKLENIPAHDKVLLKNYLRQQGVPLVSSIQKGNLSPLTQSKLDNYIREIYG